MKIEIKSWMNDSVLFSLETKTLKLCLEMAIKSRADLRGANLCRADLRGANLCRANLSGADLCRANLYGANLRGADLSRANLRGADLSRANLYRANLSGADLSRADLSRADLSGADLYRANLSGADLSRAEGVETFPIQIIGHKHFLQTTQDGSLRIGCEEHAFDEWPKVAEKLGEENGYSALDVEIYKLHIEHIAKVSQLLWNQKKEAST